MRVVEKDLEIRVKTASVRIGPIGFLEYAKEFYAAFSSFKPKNKTSPASYYLICRSIELSLKSYLLAKGVDIKKVKYSLGHDLHKILKKAKELQIFSIVEISDVEIEQIEKANVWYTRKGFEYFELRNLRESTSTLPDLEILTGLVENFLQQLKQVCLDASND